jgi:hypothetical protein
MTCTPLTRLRPSPPVVVTSPAARRLPRGLSGDAGMVHLLIAITTINVRNRLAVSIHQELPDLT